MEKEQIKPIDRTISKTIRPLEVDTILQNEPLVESEEANFYDLPQSDIDLIERQTEGDGEFLKKYMKNPEDSGIVVGFIKNQNIEIASKKNEHAHYTRVLEALPEPERKEDKFQRQVFSKEWVDYKMRKVLSGELRQYLTLREKLEQSTYPQDDKEIGFKDAETRLTDNLRNYARIGIDLNGLKAMNDLMGHPKGDEYLNKSVEVIARVARKYSDTGNFASIKISQEGGDEFGIFVEFDRAKRLTQEHREEVIAAIVAETRDAIGRIDILDSEEQKIFNKKFFEKITRTKEGKPLMSPEDEREYAALLFDETKPWKFPVSAAVSGAPLGDYAMNETLIMEAKKEYDERVAIALQEEAEGKGKTEVSFSSILASKIFKKIDEGVNAVKDAQKRKLATSENLEDHLTEMALSRNQETVEAQYQRNLIEGKLKEAEEKLTLTRNTVEILKEDLIRCQLKSPRAA